MRTREMKHLIAMASRLTPAQRGTLLASPTSGLAHSEALELVQG